MSWHRESHVSANGIGNASDNALIENHQAGFDDHRPSTFGNSTSQQPGELRNHAWNDVRFGGTPAVELAPSIVGNRAGPSLVNETWPYDPTDCASLRYLANNTAEQNGTQLVGTALSNCQNSRDSANAKNTWCQPPATLPALQLDENIPLAYAFGAKGPYTAGIRPSPRIAPTPCAPPVTTTISQAGFDHVSNAWLADFPQNLNADEPIYFCFGNHGQPATGSVAPTAPTLQHLQDALDGATGLTDEVRHTHTHSGALTPATKRKRKKFDEDGRAKVKRVRKLGACFRCRIYKLTCNEELPCLNCKKVKATQRVYRGPCVRLNIEEVHFFRAGDGDNGTTRAVLPEYRWPQEGNTKVIKIRWPFRESVKRKPVFSIECCHFVPGKEPVNEEWTLDGVVHQVAFPPWACRNTTAARKEVENFMLSAQSLLEEEIGHSLRDPILLKTWTEVQRHHNKYSSSMLQKALQIYAGAMMNTRYPQAVEGNVFGVADPVAIPFFFEKIPLPPQLTYQIQTLVAQVMTDIQTQLLAQLKTCILGKNRHVQWYEIFLTLFVMLCTIEWCYQNQVRFLQIKQGVSTRNLTNMSYVTQYMVDEWESSAFNIIGHFRCVMNGQSPFAQSWDDDADMPRRTGLDAEGVKFVRDIKKDAELRREEFLSMRTPDGQFRFEKPLAAICELFLPPEDELVQRKG